MAGGSTIRHQRNNSNNTLPVQVVAAEPVSSAEEETTTTRFRKIQLNFSYFSWIFVVFLSTYIICLCFECYLEAKLHPRTETQSVPFFWPIYGEIDSRLQSDYVVHPLAGVILFVLPLCITYTCFVNKKHLSLSSQWRKFIISSKSELDLLFNYLLSFYLAFSTEKDPLIVFGITAIACFISAWLGILLGPPNPELTFQVLNTFFSCTISYSLAKYATHTSCLFLASQITTFVLYVPLFLYGRGRPFTTFRRSCAVLLCLFLFLILVTSKALPAA